MHGLNTLEHQPAKVAAMEGNWETGPNVPLLLFALPDEEARENRFEIGIPNLASIILTHHADGVVPGLNDFVTEDGRSAAPARRAGLLGLSRHGRHRHGHAGPQLGRAGSDGAPPAGTTGGWIATRRGLDGLPKLADLGAGRDDLLGLAGDTRGLVRRPRSAGSPGW